MPKGVFPRISVEERFWAKVEFTDTCWLWHGTKTERGYGQFRLNRHGVRAHRWAYEYLNDVRVPRELVMDHLCRTHECVRFDHLEPVTTRENVLRGDNHLHAQKAWEVSAAAQRVRTHCVHGHEYTHENTRPRWVGAKLSRVCRACSRAASARKVAMR